MCLGGFFCCSRKEIRQCLTFSFPVWFHILPGWLFLRRKAQNSPGFRRGRVFRPEIKWCVRIHLHSRLFLYTDGRRSGFPYQYRHGRLYGSYSGSYRGKQILPVLKDLLRFPPEPNAKFLFQQSAQIRIGKRIIWSEKDLVFLDYSIDSNGIPGLSGFPAHIVPGFPV